MRQKITPLRIVVPDGSMQEVITNLLARAGLPVVMSSKRTKTGKVAVDWIDQILFQRPQEIPHYLHNDHFDVAILGEDWIANWGYYFPVLLKLPIGRSGNKSVRIVLAVSETRPIEKVQDLPRCAEVATEYVQLAQNFFKLCGREDIMIIPSAGNTEQKIHFGADAVIDVTESGESLHENRLKIIHTLMESNTVIVANQKSLADESKRFLIGSFTELIRGAAQAMQYVLITANVPKNVLNQASKIIGGLKGPTCSELLTKDGRQWFSLQSIVKREDEQRVILELLRIKVTNIFVQRDIPLIMS